MVVRAMLVLLALALPTVAAAGTWRWRDGAGRLHYTNLGAEAPPHAVDLDATEEPRGVEWTIEFLRPLPSHEDRLPTVAGEDTRFA